MLGEGADAPGSSTRLGTGSDPSACRGISLLSGTHAPRGGSAGPAHCTEQRTRNPHLASVNSAVLIFSNFVLILQNTNFTNFILILSNL